MKFFVLLILIFTSLTGCIAGKGDIKIDLKNRKLKSSSSSNSSIVNASVSSVQIINNQIVITGTGLNDVENVKVDGNSLNEIFSIETKSATQIIANSIRAFSFDVSKVFNLILSDASASATFPIDFSLCNSSLNGKGFDCTIAAMDKDVLSFDQATNKWKPRSINGLSYQGSWDATDPLPSTTTPGDYFIVSVASAPYGVGDWIVWNGGSFDQISNSTTITSVFGRTGAVVATEGDYNLNKLLDVDLTVAPTAGKILKYDGTKWIAGDDLSGGGAGSITSTEIAANAVTDAKIDSVSASKITGTLTSAQIADGAIVNADINAAAAIDYSKLNIPAGSIPYAKLNIADGDIPAAKISGLPAATSILAATIVDADTTHAPDGNAVFDALGLKLNLTGGTLSIGTISGVPTPTNSDDVANKGYTDTRDALKLAKAGDTMAGALTLDSDLKIKGGTNYVTVKGHATSATYNLTLPVNGGTSGYVLATDGSGGTSWVDVTSAVTNMDTDDVDEATNLYFTEARVLGTDLAGLNTGTSGVIAAADTVLSAFGKTQYQITDLKSKGQWDKTVNDISYSAGNVSVDKKLRLKDSATNYVELVAPATVTTTYTLTFPANDGNSNQVLRTDGAGVLTWVDITDSSVVAFARSALPTCNAGEVLKSNGTSFSCVTDNAGAGAFSGTASKAVVTGAGGALDVSATSATEIGYVAGVTSAIQTQLNNKEPAITAGTTAQYLNGAKNFVTLDTLAVPENTNLYFTEPRVLATDLLGFTASNSAIVATDSVLTGLEKAQGQITNLGTIKANVAGDTFTGDVTLNTQLRLKDGSAGNYVILKAPASGTTTHTLTLPGTVGSSGQVLSMTGTAGVLAWTTPATTAAPNGSAGGDLSGTYPNPTITGLDAAKLATGVVDNTEFNYLNGVTSSIQTQLTGKQATDATLTAFAGYNTNGILVQTAADTFVGRSIAGTSNRVAVTNGDGVSGNPTINVSTSLLPSPVVGDIGKYLKATAADTSVWTALSSSDITTALGFTPIDKAGDSLTTGTFTLSGAAVLRTPDPIGLTDVANKQYVDSYGQWTKSGSDIYRGSGNVSVGPSSATYLFSVEGSTAAGLISRFYNSATNGQGVLIRAGETNAADRAFQVASRDDTKIMTVNSNGKVGIGTTTPVYQLDIQNTTTDAAVRAITYGTNSNIGGTYIGARARGTVAAPTHPLANDLIAQYLGKNAVSGATNPGMIIWAGENQTNTAQGDFITFMTTPNTTVNSTEKMRITGSGNVGIGTSAPAATLHVNGTYQYNAGGSDYFGWGTTGPSNALSVNDLDYNRAAANSVYRINNHTGISMSAHTSYGGIRFYNQGYDGAQTNPYLTTLASPPTMVMALTSGRVGVGTTAPLAKLQVNGTTTAAGFEGISMAIQDTQTVDGGWARGFGMGMNNKNFARIGVLGNRAAGVDSLSYLYFSVDENTVSPWVNNSMVIKSNGFVGIGTTSPDDRFVVNNGTTIGRYTAAGWTHSSDFRLKHNIKTLDNSLDKILKLRGVSYVLNTDPEKSNQIGFIAQEVEPLFPEVVKTDKDGYKSMVYSNLIAPLIEAFKDLYEKVVDNFKTTERNSRVIASVDLKVKKLEEENAVKSKEMAALKKENAALKNDLEKIKKHLNIK